MLPKLRPCSETAAKKIAAFTIFPKFQLINELAAAYCHCATETGSEEQKCRPELGADRLERPLSLRTLFGQFSQS